MTSSDLIDDTELTALDDCVNNDTCMLITLENEADSALTELVGDCGGHVTMGDNILNPSIDWWDGKTSNADSEAQMGSIFAPKETLTSDPIYKPLPTPIHNYSTSESSDDENTAIKPPVKRLKSDSSCGPTGISISARSSRAAREAVKNDTFEVSRKKEARWREKIGRIDQRARFFPNNVKDVGHFACGKTIKVKDPFDTTRFRRHVKDCQGDKKKVNAAGNTCTLAELMAGKWGQAAKTGQKVKQEKKQERLPCRGHSEADHMDIPIYLY